MTTRERVLAIHQLWKDWCNWALWLRGYGDMATTVAGQWVTVSPPKVRFRPG